MLVILAIVAYYIGQIATIGALFGTTVVCALARHPLAVLPLGLAGLWIAGTVDFVDLSDGPMRIDAEANLQGIGAGVPEWLSNGDDGPVWWIPTAAAVFFALLLVWPKIPNLRSLAVIGLGSLAATYGGLAGLSAMY